MYVVITSGGPGKGKMYREYIVPSEADIASLPTTEKNVNGDSCER